MRFSKIAGYTLIAAVSACGGQTSVAPAVAASPPAASPPTAESSASPASAAPAAADTAAPAPTAPPTCVAMGRPCQINDTHCCYGACRVYNGSATPVCAP